MVNNSIMPLLLKIVSTFYKITVMFFLYNSNKMYYRKHHSVKPLIKILRFKNDQVSTVKVKF